MRRILTLAAFLLAFSLIPVSAQRGGMRGGFGSHGGGSHFSGGHFAGGHTSAGRPAGGMHFGGGFHFNGTFDGRFHRGGFRHCWGCRARFGFPWFAGYWPGYYDPFWSDSYSSYDYDQERDRQIADQENSLNLQEQNLREREEWLRSREDQDAYARQAASSAQASKPSPSTVLVFRDQHQQEIANYAIYSGTLWVLSDHSVAKKIPLTDLDLEATAKANDERGVEFQLPK